MTIPSYGKNVEQLKSSYFAIKSAKSHFKKSLAFLIKLNMHFINDKAVPFLDIYPNKLYAHTQKLVSQCL